MEPYPPDKLDQSLFPNFPLSAKRVGISSKLNFVGIIQNEGPGVFVQNDIKLGFMSIE